MADLRKDPTVPKKGWYCSGVTDLGVKEPCEMCGTGARFHHRMHHLEYRSLDVGCECATKMEADPHAAQERERGPRNRAKRLERWLEKEWDERPNGNLVLRDRGRTFTIIPARGRPGYFKGVLSGHWMEPGSLIRVKCKLFDLLELAKSGKLTERE